MLLRAHSMFLEHWNRQKILLDIWQRFSCQLDECIEKICNFFFTAAFFLKSTLSVLRCTWTGQINLKIFLGYNINYLSIWPFMRHPWFPTRKASKLTFLSFQLQLFGPCIVFNIWSWKQTNARIMWIMSKRACDFFDIKTLLNASLCPRPYKKGHWPLHFYNIANFVASLLKWLQMILNDS